MTVRKREDTAQNYRIFCQFGSKLAITHTIAIKWKEKYHAVVVDCHHSLRLCGDRMIMSLHKKNVFFRETPTSPWVPFRVIFRPSFPLAYSQHCVDPVH